MIVWLEFQRTIAAAYQVEKFPRRPGNDLPAPRPNDGARAPGGEFSYGEVRAVVREAVMKLGLEPVRKVLDHEGDGARKLSQLEFKYFDIVYEACSSLL